MNEKLISTLNQKFQKHRIVFWYDDKMEMQDVFENLELEGVKKEIINNNEFQLKYKILRQETEQKFLLYYKGSAPEDKYNWLLDIELSHTEFRADVISFLLVELGLPDEFRPLVDMHRIFFQDEKRKALFLKRKISILTETNFREILISIITKTDSIDWKYFFISLIDEYSKQKEESYQLLNRCNLSDYFWNRGEEIFGFKIEHRNWDYFLHKLFQIQLNTLLDSKRKSGMDLGGASSDSLILIDNWKSNTKYTNSFTVISNKYETALSVSSRIQDVDPKLFQDSDLFPIFDKEIIRYLIKKVENRTIHHNEVKEWIDLRKNKYYYKDENINLYETIYYASAFLSEFNDTQISPQLLDEIINVYTKKWYVFDQYYRNFIYYKNKSNNPGILSELEGKVENFYSNEYLLKLNYIWQDSIEHREEWKFQNHSSQKDFFKKWVQPYVDDKIKVCVIISDALRYEVGQDLLKRIKEKERYDGELDYCISMIPSYTQLGMAALLPNSEIEMNDLSRATISVDGQSTIGLENRKKILSYQSTKPYDAYKFEDIKNLGIQERRERFKNNSVLYIYHNTIDSTGDNLNSEHKVFEAVHISFEEIFQLIKMMNNANFTHFLVTSDHGFIYQNHPIQESDFLQIPNSENILYKNRRFLIGKNLPDHMGLKKFTSKQINLKGDFEVQIPKSILRIRLQGSGSRFVHGGTSLQEIVVPILKIKKARENDIEKVGFIIYKTTSNSITSSVLSIKVSQDKPISEKIQPITLRFGIFNKEGVILSNLRDILLDRLSEEIREREFNVVLNLTSEKNLSKNKDVYLIIYEFDPQTGVLNEKEKITYIDRRSIEFNKDFE